MCRTGLTHCVVAHVTPRRLPSNGSATRSTDLGSTGRDVRDCCVGRPARTVQLVQAPQPADRGREHRQRRGGHDDRADGDADPAAERLTHDTGEGGADRDDAEVDGPVGTDRAGQLTRRDDGLAERGGQHVGAAQPDAGGQLERGETDAEGGARPRHGRGQERDAAGDAEGGQERSAVAEPVGEPQRDHGPDEGPRAAGRESCAVDTGSDVVVPGDPDDEVDDEDLAPEVEHGRVGGERTQVGVTGDEGQPVAEPAAMTRVDRRLGPSRGPDAGDAGQIGQGIQNDGERRPHGLHEQAGQARSADLGDRARALHGPVRLAEPVARDQRGHVGEAADLEEHVAHSDHERDRGQQRQRQPVRGVRRRDDQERRRADQVDGHHHPTLPAALQPVPDQQRQDHVGQPRRGGDRADATRSHVQRQGRDQGQGGDGDLAADEGRGLARPVPPEVPVAAEQPGPDRRLLRKNGHF
jgi:hypothetical protein